MVPEMPLVIGFDVETSITNNIKERKLYVVTLGGDDWQVVLDWVRCSQEWKDWAIAILTNPNIQKIGHNIGFDISTMFNERVVVKNVWDTMIAEVVLNNGLLMKYPSLAELVELRLFRFMDKSIRTTYNGEPLSDAQVHYAAKDTRYLPALRRLQYMDLHEKNLCFTAALEMETVPAMALMEYEGVKMSENRWKEALAWAEASYDKARIRLQETVENDPRLLQFCIDNQRIIAEDKVVINWASHQQKARIAEHFFHPMTGLSKPMLKRAYAAALSSNEPEFADMFLSAMNDDFSKMQEYIIKEDKDWLIAQGYMYQAGTCLINWNSSVQMRELGIVIAPNLKSMDAKYIKNREHPFFKALIEYNEWQKRIGTYGENFLAHIQSDGRVHSQWVQIVDTGRTASRKPNMQNIPARGEVANRYRRAFIPEEGNVLIGADFSGQEAVLAAYVFKEPAWLDALKAGHDLHSTVAELVFAAKWKDTAEQDCAYYTHGKQKCNCKTHKKLRDQVKTINFGLIYGMTESKLSEELKVSRTEALGLRQDYFNKLPAMARNLKKFQLFGVLHGYTMTIAPYYRKRWFPYWDEHKHYAKAFASGIYEHQMLADIARQSGNTPIQGSGADMIKTALVLLYHWILEHDRLFIVKPILLVHDELQVEAPETEAEQVSMVLKQCMKAAGSLLVPIGLIDAEVKTSHEWSK